MPDSSSSHKIYLSWKIPDEGIAKGVLRELEADGFKVVGTQHGRSLITPIETEIITEMMSGSVLFVGILNRNQWVRDQEEEYKFASILGIPILTAITDVTRFDDLIPSLSSYLTAPHGVVLIETDKDMGEVISHHVHRFFDNGGRFDDEQGIETLRAAKSTAGKLNSQVTASRPTELDYNSELEKLLRAEMGHETPDMAKVISALLVNLDDSTAARLLAESWELEGKYEKAAVVRRHLESLQPEEGEAQEALKEPQEKEAAPTGETSDQKQTSASQTNAPEQTSTPASVEASSPPSPPKYSDNFQRVITLAGNFQDRFDQPEIDRAMLLVSLFLYQEESPAFLALSTFGIRAESLLARLWENYGRSYPASLTPGDMKRGAEKIFQAEVRLRTDKTFYIWTLPGDFRPGTEMLVKLAAVGEQQREVEPRHLFWMLMLGDTTGWIEETLGQSETACIKRLLEKKGFDANITREDVLDAAVADRLFANPPAYRDSAAVDDLLGFEDYANALVDIICKPETHPPLVVGVYGPWGSGKSTFMGIVKKKLDTLPPDQPPPPAPENKWIRFLHRTLNRIIAIREGVRQMLRRIPLVRKFVAAPPLAPPPQLKVVTIEYDAWAYADTPKLWSGLIRKIAKELDAELGWRGRLAYLCKRHSRALLAALVVGLVPVVLLGLILLGQALGSFIPALKIGTGLANFAQWIGLGALVGQDNSLGKIAGIATSLASLLYAFILQKRPVTDAVTALAARFDAAPAAGIVSRIQDEFKTAVQMKINPAEKPETDETRKSNIKQRVEQKQLKIVVFIDELDRCPLERIVDILEAIKLFLAEDIFIVFLGVDTRVAAEAIRLHYKEVKNPDLPREYLEKIVQLPLRVPTADSTKLQGYLKSFMPQLSCAGDATTANTSPPAAMSEEKGVAQRALASTPSGDNGHQSAVRGERPGAMRVANDENGATREADDKTESRSGQSYTQVAVDGMTFNRRREAKVEQVKPKRELKAISKPPSLPDTEHEFNRIAKLAANFLESNPRRIKRLLNTYRYVKILASVSGEPVGTKTWQEAMLAWLAFTMKWPAFMEQAVEAAEKECEREQRQRQQSAGNNAAADNNEGHAPRPDPFNFLSTLLREDAGRDQQPTAQEITDYLPFNAAQITKHYKLAGNFLVENPRPYADARDATPPPTATAKATTKRLTTPRVRKNKTAMTEPQRQP